MLLLLTFPALWLLFPSELAFDHLLMAYSTIACLKMNLWWISLFGKGYNLAFWIWNGESLYLVPFIMSYKEALHFHLHFYQAYIHGRKNLI